VVAEITRLCSRVPAIRLAPLSLPLPGREPCAGWPQANACARERRDHAQRRTPRNHDLAIPAIPASHACKGSLLSRKVRV